MMNDATQPVTLKPDGEMLRGFWYPALRGDRVPSRRLTKAMLLEVPLVLGRDVSGKTFALQDTCPHRGMPLSCGWFDGREVQCCYHGWKFECHSGRCTEIPSLTEHDKLQPEKISATAFPCEERDGYVWVYLPLGKEEPPPAPELPKFSQRYRTIHLEADLPSNVDHGIIGLMDPAHGPFVHASWFWRSRSSIHTKEKRFEPIPQGFRMLPHSPSANSAPYKLLKAYGTPTTTIEFVLPNQRFEQIRAGEKWFSSRATVTPIERNRCRIDWVASWNIFPWLPVKTLLGLFGRVFIEQDRDTMVKQAVGLKHSPQLMLIDDADRPAKWYFQLKAACLKAQQTGGTFEHPIEGPVTLRWRS